MKKGRMEGFSDGVVAVIITIMVLELKPPASGTLGALRPLLPVFLAYVLSFLYVGIYWANHHHLLQAVEQVNGAALWANLHLLFWLSLVPFTTAWVGESHFASWPLFVYGVVLLMAGVAYFLLARILIGLHGGQSFLARSLGGDRKTKLSIAIYAVSLALCWWQPAVTGAGYIAVAAIWLIPDRRLERTATPIRPVRSDG